MLILVSALVMFRKRQTSSVALDPKAMARLQAQSSGDMHWGDAIKRIMALTTKNPTAFASQPFANRANAILEAVVPARKNPTHEKVLEIINALIETGAIRPDEGGQMYNALLDRVSRYNSVNVQNNLDRLGQDVRTVVSQKERSAADNLGSVAALNAFISSLPATVERGQDTYLAFISALRLLVSEVPQTEVYQSGPDYFLQTSRNGSHTVNLSKAFDNLQPLWGVKAPVAERTHISALLTPNTRLLLLLLSPFTDGVIISRDSYLGYLLSLYRETIGQAHLDERTYNEITSVSRAVGSDRNADNLQETLNFLLTNRRYKIPTEYQLTPKEEKVLRYVQQAVSLRLMQGMNASAALDEVSRNLEPSFYAAHRLFINKLMDYFHRAAAIAPDYFTNAILNAHWLPPDGFYTGIFDFPEADDGFVWDDSDISQTRSVGKNESGDDGLYSSMPLRGRSRRRSNASDTSDISLGRVRSRSRIRRSPDIELESWTRPKNTNVLQAAAVMNNDVEQLVDKMSRWRTYAQEQKEAPLTFEVKKEDKEDEEWRKDRFLKFEGSGITNLFSHLKPHGCVYKFP